MNVAQILANMSYKTGEKPKCELYYTCSGVKSVKGGYWGIALG